MPMPMPCATHALVTAGGKGYLRTMSLSRLKNYVQAYNIKIGRDVLEKDDIIDAIIAARVRSSFFCVRLSFSLLSLTPKRALRSN